MAKKIVLVDTSILIDLFRKTDKSNSKLVALVRQGYSFQISAITEYEIFSGATSNQLDYWNNLLEKIQVLPFDQSAVKAAVEINQFLKLKRKQIDIADLFIAATAISNNLPFATLNKKHFERIEELVIIE
ncbi:type II toxin-antitoxin system VapC family toxin [Dyadobacter sp. 3J3]|uniref:type II toxin-antitoxin system VapC family toxin n=1 Tax=Dyadobacter sp. 3J3 TaxID=2606600 RepID=UPI0013579383|nr:type II toxin-antitoxin system VapC family toxin [Dyadobacter sp. 3J3]